MRKFNAILKILGNGSILLVIGAFLLLAVGSSLFTGCGDDSAQKQDASTTEQIRPQVQAVIDSLEGSGYKVVWPMNDNPDRMAVQLRTQDDWSAYQQRLFAQHVQQKFEQAREAAGMPQDKANDCFVHVFDATMQHVAKCYAGAADNNPWP